MQVPADRLTADDRIMVNGQDVFVVRKQDGDRCNPWLGLVVTPAFAPFDPHAVTVQRTDRFTLLAA